MKTLEYKKRILKERNLLYKKIIMILIEYELT